MSCVPIPDVPLPTLPVPLTIAPTFPTESFDPELCCKILAFPLTTPPIPLPSGVFNPALCALIANTLKTVQDYLDRIPHDCPKELQRPSS